MTDQALTATLPAQPSFGLAVPALLLVIVLVSLSAYLRLAHSGIGCDGWPECYGRIGEPPVASAPASPADAYERMGHPSSQPHPGTTLLHRLVASVLGLLIIGLNVSALRRRKFRLVSLMLLALTVFLASIGLRSGSLHSPAIVMGNLAGGFAMLALLGWMVFSDGRRADGTGHPGLRMWTLLALVLLLSQILVGGLTSANFAATACRSLPDCHGAWLPGPSLETAFDLTRQLQVTESGFAIGGEERAAIHMTHRIGGVLTLVALLGAGIAAIRAGAQWRTAGVAVVVLAIVEFGVGVTAVAMSLPIGIAVAHNWIAGLVLLALLKLLALNTGGRPS